MTQALPELILKKMYYYVYLYEVQVHAPLSSNPTTFLWGFDFLRVYIFIFIGCTCTRNRIATGYSNIIYSEYSDIFRARWHKDSMNLQQNNWLVWLLIFEYEIQVKAPWSLIKSNNFRHPTNPTPHPAPLPLHFLLCLLIPTLQLIQMNCDVVNLLVNRIWNNDMTEDPQYATHAQVSASSMSGSLVSTTTRNWIVLQQQHGTPLHISTRRVVIQLLPLLVLRILRIWLKPTQYYNK